MLTIKMPMEQTTILRLNAKNVNQDLLSLKTNFNAVLIMDFIT